MRHKHLISSVFTLALLALSACSSSFGSGSPPPHDTTIVVPADSSVTH